MKSFSRLATPFHNPLFRLLSSSPAIGEALTLAADRLRDPVQDSLVYQRSMLRRPPVVERRDLLSNWCSFIGRVVQPVRMKENPNWGSYTVLEVGQERRRRPTPPPSDPESDSASSSFRLLLTMKDKLSEISLKPNDYIYVHGLLRSYEKVNDSGKHELFYKVLVMELDFIKSNDPNQVSLEPASSSAEESTVCNCAFDQAKATSCVLTREEEYRERLRLWQVFFANPYEWWDDRIEKRSSRSPDFKHKDTKECLWLRPDDPPWVRKQLQLCDSEMAGGNRSQRDGFEWKLDDLE